MCRAADSSSTGGALSTQRVTLTGGADGAKPHWHNNSAEMFFLLDHFLKSEAWDGRR